MHAVFFNCCHHTAEVWRALLLLALCNAPRLAQNIQIQQLFVPWKAKCALQDSVLDVMTGG